MNEYIIIYQSRDEKRKTAAIEDYFRQCGFQFQRLGDGHPYLGHIQSDMDTEQLAGELRAQPMNKGTLLFSVSKAVLV